ARLRAATRKGGSRGRTTVSGHLFRKGMLTCAECGDSMVPRSSTDTYYCMRRKRLGPDSCGMPNVPRALIDGAVVSYFERVALDVDATRARFTDTVASTVAAARNFRQEAERELGRSVSALQRVKRDYTSGDLTADEWRELRGDLEAERR